MPCDDCSRAENCPPCVNESEPCLTRFPEGPCAGVRKHPGDCTPNADDIALPPEPEAPEEPVDPLPDLEGMKPIGWTAEWTDGVQPLPCRRPPYAVAYELASGEQYEVALPGDATVCAQQGALVITHGSAVQALIQIRPMEGA